MKEIRGFKGFDKNLKCQGFQYEFGKPYETDKAVMCEIGYRGHASAVGYYGHASAVGYYGHAEVSGKNSIACGIGIANKARGKIGCWLVLAEWQEIDSEWVVNGIESVKVDGDKIKADVWYEVKSGEFVEVV